MSKQYDRRDFSKLIVLGGIGYSLWSCTSAEKKEKEQKETLSEEILPIKKEVLPPELSPEHVLLFERDAAEYDALNVRFNKRIQHSPLYIAKCFTTKGVQQAVLFAQYKKCKIAIKSGGHSFEGFSNNTDGLVIDLSEMNAITWLNDTEVTIQPACILSKLYDNILPKKRIIPAGSCATVGIGGLTLGGGYGFFSRKYGLTCDSLLEVTLVDGKGNIHNSKDNPELLKACRGGGNGNFGVITEFKFITHPAPDYFQAFRCKAYKLTAQKAKQLLEVWFQHAQKLPESCFAAFVLNGKTLTILITNYEDNNKAVLEMVEALRPLSSKVSIGNKRPLAKALKTYYGVQHPLYFKNACAGMYKDFNHIEGCIETVLEKVINSRGLIYQVNTLGGAINTKSFTATSVFPHRHYPFLSELQSYWEKPSQEARLLQKFQEVQEVFANHGITDHYRNYPDINFKNWEKAYYGIHTSSLKQLKKELDPNNIFSHPQSVTI